MKLLLEAEVVAHAVVSQNHDVAVLRVPDEGVELHLKNKHVERGIDNPLLEAQLIFEGPDLDSGLEGGMQLLQSLLNAVSYVTSCTFRIDRATRLVDWSDGDFERDMYIYQKFPGHQLPITGISQDLLDSAALIWSSLREDPLSQAVHWFAAGVRASLPEEQFINFWFVAEVLSSISNDRQKVPDLCAICRTPLYCRNCAAVPEHRPYPRQQIEKLLRRFIRNDEAEENKARLTKLFKVRNLIAHGHTRKQIEESIGRELPDCVEDVAQLAKVMLIEFLREPIAKEGDIEKLNLLMLNGYAHTVAHIHALVRMGSFPPDLGRLPPATGIKIDLVYNELSNQDDG